MLELPRSAGVSAELPPQVSFLLLCQSANGKILNHFEDFVAVVKQRLMKETKHPTTRAKRRDGCQGRGIFLPRYLSCLPRYGRLFLFFPIYSFYFCAQFFAASFRKAHLLHVSEAMNMERDRLTKKEYIISGTIWSVISAGTILAAIIGGKGESKEEFAKDDYSYQPKNEKIISPPTHVRDILLEDFILSPHPTNTSTPQPVPAPTPVPTPTAIVSKEVQVDNSDKLLSGEKVNGWATYYGVDDGYGLEDSLGCTGEPFDPYDETTAARPLSSPFQCGDKVEVCDADSCIDVYIKDTCPGCDDYGIVIDLSYGAMQKLSPGAGRASVTLEEIK